MLCAVIWSTRATQLLMGQTPDDWARFPTSPSDLSVMAPVYEVPTGSTWEQPDAGPMLEQRLAELEAQMKAANSKIGDKTLMHSGHSGSTMKITGRIHLDYWGFPDSTPGTNLMETGNSLISPQDRVAFRRLRLGMQGDLPENMTYKIEFDFAAPDALTYKDVYLGWNELPFFQTLLIGNQKRPYGLDHLNSSRYNVFLERPMIIEAINQDARRVGIASYGVSEDERYNWRFGIYNQRNTQEEGSFISDHLQPEFTGRWADTFWYDETSDGRGYAHWGISGTAAHPDGSSGNDPSTIGFGRSRNEARFRTRPESRTTSRWIDTGRIAGANWYEMLGLETVVNLGPTQVVAEYQSLWLQRDTGAGDTLHFHGGYVYWSYFLTGEHIPWERDSGTIGRVKPFENFFLVDTCDGDVGRGLGAWQIAVRWSYSDFNDDDIFGGYGEIVTAALNWHWTPYAKVQCDYSYVDMLNRDTNSGAGVTLTSGHASVVGARFLVDF